jgi:O-acetyl-ADP-ribose deacetylase (regulator of RNase III)
MERIIGNALAAPEGVFVHGCNAQGVMGSGVAKEVKAKYPKAFESYAAAHARHALKLGTQTSVEVRPNFWIVNGVTQEFYGREPGRVYVNYDAVRHVFREAGRLAEEKNLPLLFPLIGCGLGGGDWARVTQIIEEVVPTTVRKVLFTLDNAPLPTDASSEQKKGPSTRPRFS